MQSPTYLSIHVMIGIRPLGMNNFQMIACIVGLGLVLGMQWIKERGVANGH